MIDLAAQGRNVGHESLLSERRAEHIMSMPAVQRRWTAQEVRELIAESRLELPPYVADVCGETA